MEEMELRNELQMVKKELQMVKEREQQYKDDVDYYKKLVEMTGDLAKKSTRSLGYLIKNHQQTPPLARITDQRIKQLEYQNRPHDLTTIVMTHHHQKTLPEFLGDFILSIYKQDDVTQQSIWSTDTSRLTYVIRDFINKKPKWAVDKKGVKTKSQIIDPLLEHIQSELMKRMDGINVHREQYGSHEEYFKAVKYYGDTVITARQLTDGPVSNRILKYIAPKLTLDRDQ